MNKKDISIIIPSYNCEETLEEAVDSCFVQGLKNFEIVLVDDCSTDKTRDVMKLLSDKHREVKLFYHEKNKGGGATRNTAVENSSSDVIFCLDSDDMLPEGTLNKMLRFMKEKNVDAVGVHRSIKFRGTDKNDIEHIDIFSFAGEKVPFDSLLQRDDVLCPLYSTFMITKNAFTIAGGYPIHHGFDTQGFAWRFLMHGLTAYTCPDAEYLHRINFHPSYYIREYNAGNINYNWQLILEEFTVAFSEEAKNLIFNANLTDPDTLLLTKVTALTNVWAQDVNEIVGKDISLLNNRDKKIKKIAFKSIKRSSFYGIIRRVNKKLNRYFTLLYDTAKVRDFRVFLLLAFMITTLKKYFKVGFNVPGDSFRKIDIVIPTILKDGPLLSKTIESLTKNIQHVIGGIYIVSRESIEMREFCEKNGYIFVDEITVLGYGKEKIVYNWKGLDRRGWVLQQLLKLSGDKITKCDDYIIVDSDTMLINPHSFIVGGKYVFFENEEWNEPYFLAYEKIFGYKPKNRLSFTSHMMIFNRQKLDDMKKEMEKIHYKKWDEVYLSVIDESEMSSISDYDTYANWVWHNHPGKVLRLPFYNKSMSRTYLEDVEPLRKKFGYKYKSLSFHSYFQKNFKEVLKENNV